MAGTAIRTAAQAYAAGDQVAPCAVLWPDPERLWESVMPELQTMLPEMFLLGNYAAGRAFKGRRFGCVASRREPLKVRAGGGNDAGVLSLPASARESCGPRRTLLPM